MKNLVKYFGYLWLSFCHISFKCQIKFEMEKQYTGTFYHYLLLCSKCFFLKIYLVFFSLFLLHLFYSCVVVAIVSYKSINISILKYLFHYKRNCEGKLLACNLLMMILFSVFLILNKTVTFIYQNISNSK